MEFTGLPRGTSFKIRVAVVPNNPNFKDPETQIAATKETKTPEISTYWSSNKDQEFYDKYKNSVKNVTELHIETAAQLAAFAQLLSQGDFAQATVYLDNDIDLSDHIWTPDGTKAFAGTFDGQNHTISGLYLNKSRYERSGLFATAGGTTTKPAVIRNLKYKDVYVLIKYSSSIRGVGGLVGDVTAPLTVENCTFENITVISEKSTKYVGGLFGYFSSSTTNHELVLRNCTIDVNVQEWYNGTGCYAGGILGRQYSKNTSVIIENCVINGTVANKKSSKIGQIAGELLNCTEVNCTKNIVVEKLQ